MWLSCLWPVLIRNGDHCFRYPISMLICQYHTVSLTATQRAHFTSKSRNHFSVEVAGGKSVRIQHYFTWCLEIEMGSHILDLVSVICRAWCLQTVYNLPKLVPIAFCSANDSFCCLRQVFSSEKASATIFFSFVRGRKRILCCLFRFLTTEFLIFSRINAWLNLC